MEHPELVARPSWGRRLVGIEGLRGLAAMTVLAHHVGSHLSSEDALGEAGSDVAVALANGLTLFFVLSGFLLYRPFAASLLTGTPAPSIRKYFRNRALRVYPAYLVIFLLVTLVLGSAYVVSPSVSDDPSGRVTDPLTFIADLLLIQTYFPSTMLSGLGVAWSLTAEIAFYIILPGLFLVAVSLLRRRVRPIIAALIPAAIMIAVGIGVTLVMALLSRGMSTEELQAFAWGQTWSAVINRSVLAQADLFGYGMLAAVAVTLLHQRGLTRTSWVPRAALLAAAVAIAVLGDVFGRSFSTNAIGVAAAILILAVVLPGSRDQEPNVLARALEWLPLRYLGLISYSIYLWHVPVIWWMKQRDLYDDASIGGVLISLTVVAAATVILSSATYYLVERPAMMLKSRSSRRLADDRTMQPKS